jgi:hypothetical protein
MNSGGLAKKTQREKAEREQTKHTSSLAVERERIN